MNIELLLRKSCTFWNPSVPKINKTCTVTDSLWFDFFWQLDSTDVLLCCNGQQAMPQNLSQGLTAVDTPAEPAACQIQMSEKSTCWKKAISKQIFRYPELHWLVLLPQNLPWVWHLYATMLSLKHSSAGNLKHWSIEALKMHISTHLHRCYPLLETK